MKKIVPFFSVLLFIIIVLCCISLFFSSQSAYYSQRVAGSNNFIPLLPIQHHGTSISGKEAMDIITHNYSTIERMIFTIIPDKVESFTILSNRINLISLSDSSAILNKDYLYYPVLDSNDNFIAFLCLYREGNSLNYTVNGYDFLDDVILDYSGEDIILVSVDSHRSIAAITPDNRIHSDVSTNMFEAKTDYYSHFHTEYNTLNSDDFQKFDANGAKDHEKNN